MRGQDGQTVSMFSYVDIEERVPASHPLRKIREFVNTALAALNAEFAELYAAGGRPSIAPERLLRAALIQILFSIRSERQLMEQMQYNLLFRWFCGAWRRRSGVGSNRVYEESRPGLEHGHRPSIPGRDPGAQGCGAAALERAFFRGRYADRSLGFHEELPAQGRSGRKRAARGGFRRGRPSACRSAGLRTCRAS